MEHTYRLFKIYRKSDGLYSPGGADADKDPKLVYYAKKWTKRGKTWNGLGALKNHLRQYCNNTWEKVSDGKSPYGYLYKYANNIPKDWVVVEITPESQTEWPAHTAYEETFLAP